MASFESIYKQEQNVSHFDRAKEELPIALKEILINNIPKNGKVLLPDGEQVLAYLDEILNKFPQTRFYVNFIDNSIYQKVKTIKDYSNIIINRNTLTPIKTEEEFDFIFTIPPFGIRGNYRELGYSSNDFSISQLEELTQRLTKKGKIIAVTIQGITFTVQAKTFRKNIIDNFKLVKVDSLPQKLFKTTNIKTTLLEITNGKTDKVTLNESILKDNTTFINTDTIIVTAKELLEADSWDITKFQIFGDETMQQYEASTCEKQKLEDMTTDRRNIFRGRSDLKYVENKEGVFVVNIADIKDSIVYFDNLKVIENDRNNRKYELENGDILLTSRGTDVRTAIFNKPDDKTYIASAGLIVIRTKDENIAKYVQIFFESEIGKKLLDTLKSGATIMNIVPEKVRELMIPILPQDKMAEFISLYNKTMNGLNKVKEEARRMVEAEQVKLNDYYKTFTSELLK